MASVGSVPEVKELVDGIRDATSARILEGLGAGDPPPAQAPRRRTGWLWFMDGVILDWLEHRDMSRAEVRDLLLASLAGSLSGGGPPDPALLAPPSISFFQIGASAFTRSMISRAPANASPRCGADTATMTLGSESGTSPTRCSTAAAQRPCASSASAAISRIRSSAIST